ncbi:MAG: hypothetical protein Q4G65_04830 [bacterium]|nr:hypothetical protein [bacterium]
MKRLMLMSTVAMFCAAVGFAAAPQMELAVTAELASFGEISKKVTAFGSMINNPIVPALVLGAGQQQLVQAYGAFRSGSPIFCHVYVQSTALEEAAKKGALDKVDGMFDVALLYPSVDGMAKMALNHPGSTKEADGTLHLLASQDSPEERWVKFTDDGRYCAFASSAELAIKAAADFSQGRLSAKKGGDESALLRVEVNECGLKTLLLFQDLIESEAKDLQKADKPAKMESRLMDRVLGFQARQSARQQMLLGSYAKLIATVDLNDSGFTVDARALPKPGAKTLPAAGFRLPKGAVDGVPAGAPLFTVLNTSLSGGYFTEAEFREDCKELVKVVREDVIAEVKKNEEVKKYGALLDELGAATEAYLLTVPYPAPGDWSSFALCFDDQCHPYAVSRGDITGISAGQTAVRAFADRAFAAFDRQWPGRAIATRSADDVYTFDWGALIDVAATEAKIDTTLAKEIANAKKTLGAVLGGTKTVCSSKVDGTKYSMLAARPGFTPPASKSTGEAAIAKALPETVKDRPAGVFYLAPYALARDVILPIVAKLSDKNTAAQYQVMLSGMAPAAPNSAVAAAGWVNADGAMRGLLRITAGEIKNLGAAFNAFTAASMSSTTEDDDDK